jgi:predicted metal-dependent peptidase
MPARDLVPTPLTAEEKAALAATTTRLLNDAAKLAGTAASSYVPRELAMMMRKKPLSWKALLREFLMEVQSDETSYVTPERKYLHMDLILPGHGMSEEGELDSIWAFVDSSGSISQEEMNRFLTELYHLVKDFQCEMNIAYWDTSVTDVYRRIRKEKDVMKAIPRHSGGTNINCVYTWVRENKIRPYVAVILTDGYFGIPDPELSKALPRRSTILVICNKSENPVYAKIGKVARLTED